jgi:hypothetical protein
MCDESKSASLGQLSAGLRDHATIGLIGLRHVRLQLM